MRRLLIPLLVGFILAVSFAPNPDFLHAQIINTESALLSWTPPTQNEDGSTLTDLSHYYAYYDVAVTDPTQFTRKVQIGGNLSSFQIDGLAVGTWCFAMKSVSAGGLESSSFSNVACKTIEDLYTPEPSPPKAPGGLAAP